MGALFSRYNKKEQECDTYQTNLKLMLQSDTNQKLRNLTVDNLT